MCKTRPSAICKSIFIYLILWKNKYPKKCTLYIILFIFFSVKKYSMQIVYVRSCIGTKVALALSWASPVPRYWESTFQTERVSFFYSSRTLTDVHSTAALRGHLQCPIGHDRCVKTSVHQTWMITCLSACCPLQNRKLTTDLNIYLSRLQCTWSKYAMKIVCHLRAFVVSLCNQ